MKHTRLGDIAYARSGDKGSSANIGVIAYTPEGFEILRQQVTVESVSSFFFPMHPSKVTRYELPKLWALNFILEDVLDGGGSQNLHIDAQGKSFGQILLELPLQLDDATRDVCLPNSGALS